MTDTTTATTNFAERVHEREVGPCHLLTLETPAERIVSWQASFQTHPDFAAGDDLRQQLAVSLLDKGTKQHDRFEIARVLESCGAELNLSSDGLYVDVSGRALREDLPDVIAVLAEILFEPAFERAEFEKARAQLAAKLQRHMEKTKKVASGALTRGLFGPNHPNYAPPLDERLAQVQELTLDGVRRYHADHFGATDFTFVCVGDIDDAAIEQAIESNFGAWAPHDAPAAHDTEALPSEAGQTAIPMPDKQNIDVRMGHALPVRRDDEDYLPLYVANYILGGNFSARLMARIRDEKGLTYGINSALSGVTTKYDGHWHIGVTLSRDKLEEGLEATRREVECFVEEGATEEELETKKTTITGSYVVGLAKTTQLARSILTNAERGFDVDYLDRFPDEIRALSLDTVNSAIQKHFDPDKFHVAMAGMLPAAENGRS